MLRMSANLLRHNAPGGTRTPNLLIRSHFLGWLSKGSTRVSVQEDDTRLQEIDRDFRNLSHNRDSE